MNAITQTIEVGGKTIHIETGRLAKQATGSVVVRLGDTMVLTTVVVADDVREGQSFFPLTVDYREKYSAAGKFPGGFLKRENRPSDKEVLTSRLIDRTIRPLFPDGFINEVQIITGVYSADFEIDADMLGGVGASAALSVTGAPFDGPTAHVRVGRVDGEFVLFPTKSERAESDFDLVVAGKEDALVMVEGEMDEVSEDAMMDAFDFAHDAIKTIIAGIKELRAKYEADRGAIEPMEYTTTAPDPALVADIYDRVKDAVEAHLRKPYAKATFYGGIRDIRTDLLNTLFEITEDGEQGVEMYKDTYSYGDAKKAFSKAESQVMREMILGEGRRLDGRATDEVRDIWSEIGYLPKAHGSAIFTRGETQSLVSVTLGTGRDVQAVDQVFDTEDKRFYLHYNFPPFSTGEAKFLRGPGRREIGHGYLAERALKPMLPTEEEFPYTVRVLSDILESNGSSSMASVCGGSLALMDAGVPIKKPVAGIAMGLIADGDRVAVLSDILGTEDHLGDMDFKVTGTEDGITACQMDIKIDGLQRSTMETALSQAKRGRDHILGEMAKTIDEARGDLAPNAPRLFQIVIDAEFIGEIIGPGGKNIRGLQAETGTKIDIAEENGKGYVTIAAEEGPGAEKAIEVIKGIVSVPEVGDRYDAKVINMLPFGAILELMPGKEALLHVSEMAHGYVNSPEDIVQIGDRIEVELIEVRDG
ncbi:MAG: polyribonucleotide nucleotidyltransferase, partial [Bacteroidota bacterium]